MYRKFIIRHQVPQLHVGVWVYRAERDSNPRILFISLVFKTSALNQTQPSTHIYTSPLCEGYSEPMVLTVLRGYFGASYLYPNWTITTEATTTTEKESKALKIFKSNESKIYCPTRNYWLNRYSLDTTSIPGAISWELS